MYIYGKNVVYETLKKGEKINKAFISDNFKDKNLINLLINKNDNYYFDHIERIR